MDIKDSKGKVIAKVTAADPNQSECQEGLWLEVVADDGTKPTICLIKKTSDWYLGVYRDANDAYACDFAIIFNKEEGPSIQVTKGKEVKTVNLFEHFSK